MREVSYQILDEIKASVKLIDERTMFRLADEILDADRVFISGSERCDILIRSFAMRLAQLSINTYIVKDPTTPAIGKNDLLIMCTKSPDNRGVIDIAKKAYTANARIAFIAPKKGSQISDFANLTLLISTAANAGIASLQSAGVIFEQSCFIIFETLAVHLKSRLNRSSEVLIKCKANLV